MNLQKPYRDGYETGEIARLVRDGYDYHETIKAFVRFEDLPTGESSCQLAYNTREGVQMVAGRGWSRIAAKFAAKRLRDRKINDPDSPVMQAVRYGYTYEQAQRLLSKGFRYEYGVFIRRDKLDRGDYRVLMTFLNDSGRLRETLGRAETLPKAQRRGYKNVVRIQRHGSLITAFHAEADLAEARAVA